MIELKNICAGYNKKQILNDISISIPKGKLISVIGPNGSGKSTLLKSITGIIPHTSGDVFIDNKKASDLSRNEIAGKIAYLAQTKNVPDMTVEQMVHHGRFPHLSYPRRYTDKDHDIVYSVLKQMELYDVADSPLSALSGGMLQNAYIAMALVQDTDYILLDEPTTYLDISNQLKLIKTLSKLADSGKGVVIVMHDLPLSFTFSHSIAVIRNGKIAAYGTPAEVSACGIVEDIFGVGLNYSDVDKNYRYIYPI